MVTPRGLAIVAALLLLTGCGDTAAGPGENGTGDTHVFHVDAEGRDVVCIGWDNGYAGGLSCDWGPPQ